MQNLWVSKCKNGMELNLCNYCDVIRHKTMNFLYKRMKTKLCTKFVQTYETW